MVLPLKCEASYDPDFLGKSESKLIFNHLLQEFDLSNRTINLANGHTFELDCGKLMFMDEDIFLENKLPSEIWGNTAIWSDKMRRVKEKVESLTGHKFQSCVVIYYPNGNSGVDFHSDLIAFGDTDFIPSVSLGEEREFILREKNDGKEFSLKLSDGSLIIMGNKCQELYDHSLPINPKYKNERINLTFRKVGF